MGDRGRTVRPAQSAINGALAPSCAGRGDLGAGGDLGEAWASGPAWTGGSPFTGTASTVDPRLSDVIAAVTTAFTSWHIALSAAVRRIRASRAGTVPEAVAPINRECTRFMIGRRRNCLKPSCLTRAPVAARKRLAVRRRPTIIASAGLSSDRHHRARPGDLFQHSAERDHRVRPGDDEEQCASPDSFIVGRRLGRCGRPQVLPRHEGPRACGSSPRMTTESKTWRRKATPDACAATPCHDV